MDMRKRIKAKQIGALCLAGTMLFQIWGCSGNPDQTVSDSKAGSGNDSAVSEGTEAVYTAKEYIDENQVDKAEVVYARADATGSVQEIRVEAVLKNHGGLEDITDCSNLTDIRNTEGDEEYTQNGNRLIWENHGEDISYKGNASEALPVGVSIRYELDGKEIAPQELIGKSGHVKLHFDYINNQKEIVTVNDTEYEVVVPFIFISAVALDKDKFINVTVSNGDVLSMESGLFAVGYAVPGIQEVLGFEDFELTEDMKIPDSLEIEADVTEFELEFTETIVLNGFFGNLEEEDLQEFRDSGDSMNDLSDASTQLVSGTQTLYEQMVLYQGYLNQYFDGVEELQDGTAALETAMGTLSTQGETLNQGAQALNQGVVSYAGAYQETMGMVEQYREELPPELVYALEQMGTGVDAMTEGSRQVADGVAAYTGGVTQVYDGLSAMSSGVEQLTASQTQLREGMTGLVTGTNTLLSGLRQFDREGIEKLSKMFGEDLQTMLDKVEALKKADEGYMNYSGMEEGKTGSVVFMIETEELKK
ncbi:MAG: hypothetical protein K2N24_04155 [Lachnospiraceae bacterium]|nr:hypothetical protein [Lachnospiraceae bacterium]